MWSTAGPRVVPFRYNVEKPYSRNLLLLSLSLFSPIPRSSTLRHLFLVSSRRQSQKQWSNEKISSSGLEIFPDAFIASKICLSYRVKDYTESSWSLIPRVHSLVNLHGFRLIYVQIRNSFSSFRHFRLLSNLPRSGCRGKTSSVENRLSWRIASWDLILWLHSQLDLYS